METVAGDGRFGAELEEATDAAIDGGTIGAAIDGGTVTGAEAYDGGGGCTEEEEPAVRPPREPRPRNLTIV